MRKENSKKDKVSEIDLKKKKEQSQEREKDSLLYVNRYFIEKD